MSLASHPSAPLILVADDDLLLAKVLLPVLSQDGYRIHLATNGKECLERFAEEVPDLILLDAVMPEPDGFACCRAIRSTPVGAEIPILMITYLEDNESVDQAFEAGATDFIPKPIHWRVLKQRIRQLLKARFDRQEIHNLNAELEYQVTVQNAELREAIDYEQLLRIITDEVRSSLSEAEILSTAVRELTLGLNLGICKVGIYHQDFTTYTIAASHAGYLMPCDLPSDLPINPATLSQLRRGETVLCSLSESIWNKITVLVCPLSNGSEFLGFLSLIRHPQESFKPQEVRLAEQVANQCVIGIRQSRLYQALQQQVTLLSNLNQTKDEFVHLVSHELRTPLVNMRMALEMIELLPQTEKQVRYIQILKNEWKRELDLVNDLLDLQSLESGAHIQELQSINLADLLHNLLGPFRLRCQEQQQLLTVHLPEHLPHLYSDAQLLNRILAELLNNACKYTPPHEQITLTVSVSPSQVQIHLTNTGVEIPQEKLPYLFDKFYRVPQLDQFKQGGTGLGLALVKKAVEHLQGEVQVKSTQGSTCFSLSLSSITPFPATASERQH